MSIGEDEKKERIINTYRKKHWKIIPKDCNY